MQHSEVADARGRKDAERPSKIPDARGLRPDVWFIVDTRALAAWLRLRQLAAPSLWLDEIIDYDVVSMIAHQPIWRWFDIFEAEHGPLFYASELAGRVFTGIEFSARIAP